ncbi:MAG: hypothetical protein ACREUR_09135 [Nitrosospira sp.]
MTGLFIGEFVGIILTSANGINQRGGSRAIIPRASILLPLALTGPAGGCVVRRPEAGPHPRASAVAALTDPARVGFEDSGSSRNDEAHSDVVVQAGC